MKIQKIQIQNGVENPDKVYSNMHKIQLKWTKKSFNKVAKQKIFIKKT